MHTWFIESIYIDICILFARSETKSSTEVLNLFSWGAMARSSRWCFEKTWSLGNKSVWRCVRWGWKWFEAEFVASAKIKPTKFSENLMGTWWGLDGVEKTQSSNNRQAWWKKMKSTLLTGQNSNYWEVQQQWRPGSSRQSAPSKGSHTVTNMSTFSKLVCLDLAWLVLACLDFFDLTSLPWIAWLELFGLTYLPLLSWLDLTWLSWLDLTCLTWLT